MTMASKMAETMIVERFAVNQFNMKDHSFEKKLMISGYQTLALSFLAS